MDADLRHNVGVYIKSVFQVYFWSWVLLAVYFTTLIFFACTASKWRRFYE
jgi:hypothetical protein